MRNVLELEYCRVTVIADIELPLSVCMLFLMRNRSVYTRMNEQTCVKFVSSETLDGIEPIVVL